MLEGIALIGGLVLAAVCFMDERKGLYICLLVGFLQEPIRKMVPGEPVFLTATAGAFLAVVFAGIILRGGRPSFQHIHAWDDRLRIPLGLFVILVLFQSLMALLFTDRPMLAGIGLVTYLTPLPMALLGYYLSRSRQGVIRHFQFYIAVCLLMTIGTYLSFAGYEGFILETVGPKKWAVSGLTLHSGFFRSPEMTGWHAATALILTVLLYAISRHQAKFLWVTGLAIVFFGGSVVITGRRKFLAALLIFFALYGLALFYSSRKQKVTKLAAAISVAALLGVGCYTFLIGEQSADLLQHYYGREITLNQDAPDRFVGMTIGSFDTVMERYGLFGGGAGIGSQGAQYYGGGLLPGAEGGLNKVTAELGIPGLIFFLWLGTALLLYLKKIADHARSRSIEWKAHLAYGVMAFLVANLFVYAAAHQVFGDMFILMVIGWIMGVALAIPRMKSKYDAPAHL